MAKSNRKKFVFLHLISILLVAHVNGKLKNEIEDDSCATSSVVVEGIKITAKETEVPVFENETIHYVGSIAEYWVDAYLMKIFTNTLYCYEGGNGDGNTGCTAGKKEFQLDEKEVTSSFEKGTCKVGRICPPEGDCWGSDAAFCLEPELSNRNIEMEPTVLDGSVSPFKRFAYHTCSRNYFCDMKKYKLPVKAGIKGFEMEFFVDLPEGEKVYLKNGDSVFKMMKNGYYLLVKGINIRSTQGSMACIKDEQGIRDCILTEGEKKNEIVRMEKDCVASKDNLMISANCRGVSEAKVSLPFIENENKDGTSASIRDLEEAIKVVYYNNKKANFNLAKTVIQINLIKRTIKEIVKTIASRDARFLGMLMGISSSTSQNLDGTFSIKGCIEPKTNLTCTTHFNFVNGVWKPKRKDDECKHEKESEVRTIPDLHELMLFPEEEVIFDEAQVSKLNGAILEKKKVVRYDTIPGYHGIGEMTGEGAAPSSSMFSFSIWSAIMNHITFILAVSAFVMSLVTCLRR